MNEPNCFSSQKAKARYGVVCGMWIKKTTRHMEFWKKTAWHIEFHSKIKVKF